MMTLKHIIPIAIIAVLPIQSFGGTDYKISPNQDCLVVDGTGCNNDIYFCGYTSNEKCAGVGNCANFRKHMQYGQSVDFNGARYYCCATDPNNLGKFKKANTWTQTRTQTKYLDGGGTCTYTQTKTACDDTWQGDECTKAECPNSGEIFRNGECIKPCADGTVFASKTSNACIKCETNRYQGIGHDDDYNPTCIQCDDKTQLWINGRGKCINKADMIAYTTADMKKCWRCNGADNFKACLQGKKPHKFCPEDYTTK